MRLNRQAAFLCGLALFSLGGVAVAAETDAGKIPISTTSDEARRLYLEGRDLAEKLRATDARQRYQQALAKDPGFALAHLGLANSAASAKEFFAEVKQAAALADKVSEPERLWIRGQDAAARGDVAAVRESWTQLVKLVPGDERAHNLMGGLEFGQQNYAAAIEAYTKATTINPSFSQPYNQLGYAYRFMERYAEAEATFKKYIDLIPSDPNPYDSYAELLMKTGKFEASIASYRKALAVDPNFIASYVGIGNDQMFMGKGAEARKTFAKLMSVARTDGEKRTALFWMGVSWVWEGQPDKAVAEIVKESAIAEAGKDLGNLSADWNLMGNILLEAGRPDEAAARFDKQLEIIDKADVPAEVKAAARRNDRFDRARIALAKKDLPTARAQRDAYAKEVAEKKVPFEVRQAHELAGMVALADKDHATAAAELEQANQQDPRVLYQLALAYQAKGDAAKARALATKAADWHALGVNYAYVHKKAAALLGGAKQPS
jgi:tetratricopeptide (TPR) repeat protein